MKTLSKDQSFYSVNDYKNESLLFFLALVIFVNVLLLLNNVVLPHITKAIKPMQIILPYAGTIGIEPK